MSDFYKDLYDHTFVLTMALSKQVGALTSIIDDFCKRLNNGGFVENKYWADYYLAEMKKAEEKYKKESEVPDGSTDSQ